MLSAFLFCHILHARYYDIGGDMADDGILPAILRVRSKQSHRATTQKIYRPTDGVSKAYSFGRLCTQSPRWRREQKSKKEQVTSTTSSSMPAISTKERRRWKIRELMNALTKDHSLSHLSSGPTDHRRSSLVIASSLFRGVPARCF
jgi:hypothetical protein